MEHDPKPFPFGCACPTEGYFLMGPRQAVGSGRGRAGRGRECHLRPRTTLPPSPSSHPPPRVPIFLSARHRRRCSLHVPCRVRQAGRQAGPLRRRALPVSTGQLASCLLFSWLASCSGQDRRRNWRHQLICTTSYFSMFCHLNFCPALPPLPSSPCFYRLYCETVRPYKFCETR